MVECFGVWQKGWYGCAKQICSPNFDARPLGLVPELVVLHSISLPPGEYGTGRVEELFLNKLDWSAHAYFEKIRGMRVSSHFVIDRFGQLVQYVSCDDRAWHAGRSTWQGKAECNDWSIGIELEGLEGELFEAAQYEALVKLLNALCRHYPIRSIVGHEHIAPGRKIDPGPGFDWKRLERTTGLPQEFFPV